MYRGMCVRQVARQLGRDPAQTAVAILALGLAIGLTTAMFSILNGVFGDLPFHDAERLLFLSRAKPTAGESNLDVSFHDYLDWKTEQTSFDDLVAFYRGTITTSGGELPRQWRGSFVSPNFFGELGVRPALGRAFNESDNTPGAEPSLIIAYDVWMNHFGGDESVVGHSLRVNNRTGTIIGVMPEDFQFPFNDQAWLPVWSRFDPDQMTRGQGSFLKVFGRLKEGVTLAQARAEFSLLSTRLARQYPASNEGIEARIVPYADQLRTNKLASQFLPMTIAVWVVYLVACVNVANMLLSSSIARRPEIAVRTAVGADKTSLVTLFFTQALLYAIGGAVLGLFLAAAALNLFNAAFVGSQFPYWVDVCLDGSSFLVAMGGLLGAAVVAGVLPAWAASMSNPAEVLRGASGATSHGVGRLRRGLVVAEVALTFSLVAVAGLLVLSVIEMTRMDHPFPTSDVLTGRIALFESKYAGDNEIRRRFFDALEQRLSELPGVRAAAITSSLPGSSFSLYERFGIEGQTYSSIEGRPSTHRVLVSPGFFHTFDAQPLAGRAFESGALGEPVVVVNQGFAERYFPDREVLGQRVRFDRLGAGVVVPPMDPAQWQSYTIVGVVPNLRIEGVGPNPKPSDGVYHDVRDFAMPFMSLAIRAQGTPESQVKGMQRAVATLDPDLPVYRSKTLHQVIEDDVSTYRLLSRLFVAFGLVALFLAMTGLYGAVSLWVKHRHREVGLRGALGARPMELVGWVLRSGSGLIATGIVLGLGMAIPGTLAVAGLIQGVSMMGRTQSFLAALTLVVAAGFAACLVPALSASRVNTLDALRCD